MDKHILTGRIDRTDHARLTRVLSRRMLPWGLRYGAILVSLVAIALIYATGVVGPILAVAYGLVLPDWLPLGLLIIWTGAMVALSRARRARVWSSLAKNPNRDGDKTFALTHQGLRMKGATGYSFTTWTGFVDVIDDPQGIVILTGPLEYIILPQFAFDGPDHKLSVLKQIAQWIAAARD